MILVLDIVQDTEDSQQSVTIEFTLTQVDQQVTISANLFGLSNCSLCGIATASVGGNVTRQFLGSTTRTVVVVILRYRPHWNTSDNVFLPISTVNSRSQTGSTTNTRLMAILGWRKDSTVDSLGLTEPGEVMTSVKSAAKAWVDKDT